MSAQRLLRWAQPRLHDLAPLVLRAGLGTMFLFHGGPKLLGGPPTWAQFGSAMTAMGIIFLPATFWGLMAGLSEFVGGLLLVLGVATRPACLFLTFTMLVAISRHVLRHDGFADWSHPAEDAVAFVSLFILGPGRYRLRGVETSSTAFRIVGIR